MQPAADPRPQRVVLEPAGREQPGEAATPRTRARRLMTAWLEAGCIADAIADRQVGELLSDTRWQFEVRAYAGVKGGAEKGCGTPLALGHA
jgi:hypothetical protein